MNATLRMVNAWKTAHDVLKETNIKLGERIRELEAELNECRTWHSNEYRRAQLIARAEKAEARVAELETQLRSTVSCNHHEMPERWYSGQREEPLDVTQERLHAQDEEREEC